MDQRGTRGELGPVTARPPVAHHSLLFGVALALFASGCGGAMGPAQSGGKSDHKLVGAQAPAFELPAQFGDAKKVSLADASGKVTIIDFWATWCEPCKDSFPHYQNLAEKYAGELVIIGISEDDDASGIAAFGKQTGVKFPLAWDDGQALSKSYDPPTMPTSYLLDKNGIVRFVHVGFHSGEEKEIENELKELMK